MRQQRSIISKKDFEYDLEQILVEGIPERNGYPDGSQIAKASGQTRSILALLERYLISRGIYE